MFAEDEIMTAFLFLFFPFDTFSNLSRSFGSPQREREYSEDEIMAAFLFFSLKLYLYACVFIYRRHQLNTVLTDYSFVG